MRAWVVAGATLVPWALGGWAVFITTAQYTGLGLFESYTAFQGGSNVGNGLWFALWTAASVLVCGILFRSITADVGVIQLSYCTMYCYGTPATLLLLPDAAMSFSVSHVRAFTDSTALHSPVVEFLVISGSAALVFAAVLSLLTGLRKRHQARGTV